MDFNLTKIKRTQILELSKFFCKLTNISEKNLGHYIRSFHISSPFTFFAIILTQSKGFAIYSFINLFVILFAFIYYNGCILSYLENKLCQDDFNIVDIILEYNMLSTTHKNRLYMTYYIATLYIFLSIIIYIIRFIY